MLSPILIISIILVNINHVKMETRQDNIGKHSFMNQMQTIVSDLSALRLINAKIRIAMAHISHPYKPVAIGRSEVGTWLPRA